MSMKRLAVLAAVGQQNGGLNGTSYNLNSTMSLSRGGGAASIHGNVNVLLGGAMLGAVLLVVVLVCYCCHRSMRKHGSAGADSVSAAQYWRETDLPMEVFTLHSQCYETTGLFLADSYSVDSTIIRPPTPGPPPPYESVINMHGTDKAKLALQDPESIEIHLDTDLENIESEDPVEKTATSTIVTGNTSPGITVSIPSDETGLPTYEAALKLEAGGYV